MVVVVVTTVVTNLRLRKAAAWRSESSSGSLSSREVALTKMLIGSSILFIICVSPICVFRLEMKIGMLLSLPLLALSYFGFAAFCHVVSLDLCCLRLPSYFEEQNKEMKKQEKQKKRRLRSVSSVKRVGSGVRDWLELLTEKSITRQFSSIVSKQVGAAFRARDEHGAPVTEHIPHHSLVPGDRYLH